MKVQNLFLAAALATGAWMAPRAFAQQPHFDFVHISLPYSVSLGGDRTLPAGTYLIQELRSEDPTVLLFYSGNGMKFEISALATKTLDPNTARSTEVTLRQIGDNYYLDKLWIQGKSFGFEFPLPKGVEEK